ncbi:hypothetical protein [Nocardia brevicatena]|nr:hypothetical protein [Nocardia brevicatena]
MSLVTCALIVGFICAALLIRAAGTAAAARDRRVRVAVRSRR